MNIKVIWSKWWLGVVPPAGIQLAEPLGGSQVAKAPEASFFFSEMLSEFVQQIDGTIIKSMEVVEGIKLVFSIPSYQS